MKAISDTACSFFVELVTTKSFPEVLSSLNEDHAKKFCKLKTDPGLAQEYIHYNNWLKTCLVTLRGSTGASVLFSKYDVGMCDKIETALEGYEKNYTK